MNTLHRKENSRAAMKYLEHRRLWRLVQGGVMSALNAHPDYLTPKGRQNAVDSITKRVVGQLVGHHKETRKGSRLGGCEGDEVVMSPSSRSG